MKIHCLFFSFPILGVMGRTPFYDHKLDPGIDITAEVVSTSTHQIHTNKLKTDLNLVDQAPFHVGLPLLHGEKSLQARHLLARYTIEPGEDGSTQRVDNLPSGWSYQDCYADTNGPTLYTYTDNGIDYPSAYYEQGDNSKPNGVSAVNCINYCDGQGYPYAGLEYHYQCSCGYRLRPGNNPSTGCTMKCYGINPQNETCGGGNRMQIYSKVSWIFVKICLRALLAKVGSFFICMGFDVSMSLYLYRYLR